ncbi:hypothetical protein PR048_016422 [Dryococelus australis]|uniref:Uncharacterized protein n=1 Tax=Dryococelus australis TaxID=614101 RepID=A0ABQ9HJP3_9NEOP|nr:hypothetical protein PR048_016422 [Dryococelus australis]
MDEYSSRITLRAIDPSSPELLQGAVWRVSMFSDCCGHLWWARSIRTRDPAPTTSKALWIAIQTALVNIPAQVFLQLVESVPRRSLTRVTQSRISASTTRNCVPLPLVTRGSEIPEEERANCDNNESAQGKKRDGERTSRHRREIKLCDTGALHELTTRNNGLYRSRIHLAEFSRYSSTTREKKDNTSVRGSVKELNKVQDTLPSAGWKCSEQSARPPTRRWAEVFRAECSTTNQARSEQIARPPTRRWVEVFRAECSPTNQALGGSVQSRVLDHQPGAFRADCSPTNQALGGSVQSRVLVHQPSAERKAECSPTNQALGGSVQSRLLAHQPGAGRKCSEQSARPPTRRFQSRLLAHQPGAGRKCSEQSARPPTRRWAEVFRAECSSTNQALGGSVQNRVLVHQPSAGRKCSEQSAHPPTSRWAEVFRVECSPTNQALGGSVQSRVLAHQPGAGWKCSEQIARPPTRRWAEVFRAECSTTNQALSEQIARPPTRRWVEVFRTECSSTNQALGGSVQSRVLTHQPVAGRKCSEQIARPPTRRWVEVFRAECSPTNQALGGSVQSRVLDHQPGAFRAECSPTNQALGGSVQSRVLAHQPGAGRKCSEQSARPPTRRWAEVFRAECSPTNLRRASAQSDVTRRDVSCAPAYSGTERPRELLDTRPWLRHLSHTATYHRRANDGRRGEHRSTAGAAAPAAWRLDAAAQRPCRSAPAASALTLADPGFCTYDRIQPVRPDRLKAVAWLTIWCREVRAAVVKWLACSPFTMANRVQSPVGSPDFRKWESCRTMPLVGGFSRGSPVSRALHSGAAPYSLQSPSSALKTSLDNPEQPIPTDNAGLFLSYRPEAPAHSRSGQRGSRNMAGEDGAPLEEGVQSHSHFSVAGGEAEALQATYGWRFKVTLPCLWPVNRQHTTRALPLLIPSLTSTRAAVLLICNDLTQRINNTCAAVRHDPDVFASPWRGVATHALLPMANLQAMSKTHDGGGARKCDWLCQLLKSGGAWQRAKVALKWLLGSEIDESGKQAHPWLKPFCSWIRSVECLLPHSRTLVTVTSPDIPATQGCRHRGRPQLPSARRPGPEGSPRRGR